LASFHVAAPADCQSVEHVATAATASSSLDEMDSVLLGRYCGRVLPGPQLSDDRASAMRVVFVSNAEGIKTGFRAKYEFVDKQPPGKRTSAPRHNYRVMQLSRGGSRGG